MSLLGFGVKNLRCLTDTGIVPIKPITLLVGRNSSGKSTFLRAFPLLRQSVENARSAPILWYDPRFVDFGSFNDAINYKAGERNIGFEFRAECRYPEDRFSNMAPSTDVFDIVTRLVDGPRGATIESYLIRYHAYDVEMVFAPDGSLLRYTVDGSDVKPSDVTLSLGGRALLLPSLQQPEGEKLSYPAFIPSNDYLYNHDDWSTGGDAIPFAVAWEDLTGSTYNRPYQTYVPVAPYAEALKYINRPRGAEQKKRNISLKVTNPKFRRLMALRIAALLTNPHRRHELHRRAVLLGRPLYRSFSRQRPAHPPYSRARRR